MDNFTPLKPAEKKKKKFSKFFIFANLFLVVLVAVIGILYYNKTLIPIKQKAGYGGPISCDSVAWDTNCQEVYEGCRIEKQCDVTNDGFEPDGGKNDKWCTIDEQDCGPDDEKKKCPNGQPPVCDQSSVACVGPGRCLFPNHPVVPLNSCGSAGEIKFMCYTNCTCEATTPTPTPPNEVTNTPTPTDVITNTPTPTPTGVITNTPTPTRTPTPTATPTGTIVPSNTPTTTPTTPPGQPTATPIPVLCGTKDCDNATNPCRSGYSCVQANDGSNYCTSPDFADACKANPSYNSCCTAPGAPTATPTEIILAKTTITTKPPVPVTGVVQSLMYYIPVLIMLIGLIL